MIDRPRDISEADLHAFVDGQLDATRRADVAAYLDTHPDDARRVAAYQEQNTQLRGMFDPVEHEPVPARLLRAAQPSRRRPRRRYAAMVAWTLVGAVAGWVLRGDLADEGVRVVGLPQRAAIAHVVYTPEVRHPVEVSAEQETHLVQWLSKRLGTQVRPPHLGTLGYELIGGRLLPGDQGPAALFMYQDAAGRRLTLYVRTDAAESRETAFRYAQEGRVGVFYWIDRRVGYALTGELDKPQLLDVATAVYRELNP